MEEQLISFETAKLAKDKGFEIQTRQYYMGSGKLFGSNIQENHNNPTFTKGKYSAPRQSLLQKWLRERKTPIVVSPETDFVAWQCYVDHPDLDRVFIYEINGKPINSYEEVLETGLQAALNLIQ